MKQLFSTSMHLRINMLYKIAPFKLFVIAAIFFSCGDLKVNQPIIKIYGNNNFELRHENILVDLKKYDDYQILYEEIQYIACNNQVPTLVVNKNDLIKYIVTSSPCLKEINCIRIRNRLKILDEKIYGKTYSQYNLDSIIYHHYMNPDQNWRFSEKPSKAFISILYEDKCISGLSDLLEQITYSFDRIAPPTDLYIRFDQLIPPPPPRPS